MHFLASMHCPLLCFLTSMHCPLLHFLTNVHGILTLVGTGRFSSTSIGALEASLRGVADCQPWCIHLAGTRFGWDQGTTPCADGGEGLDYQWVREGHHLHESQYRGKWDFIDNWVQGMSVTAAELQLAWLENPSVPVHGFVYFRDPSFMVDVPCEEFGLFSTDSKEEPLKGQLMEHIWRQLSTHEYVQVCDNSMVSYSHYCSHSHNSISHSFTLNQVELRIREHSCVQIRCYECRFSGVSSTPIMAPDGTQQTNPDGSPKVAKAGFVNGLEGFVDLVAEDLKARLADVFPEISTNKAFAEPSESAEQVTGPSDSSCTR